MITDGQMHISLVNAAFELVTGYSMDDVRGKNPHILQSGMQDASFYKNMWNELNMNFWFSISFKISCCRVTAFSSFTNGE